MFRARKSNDAIPLIMKTLDPEPEKRPTALQLIQDPYFDEVREEVANYEEYWARKENQVVPDLEKIQEQVRAASSHYGRRSMSNPARALEVHKAQREYKQISA